MEALFAAARQLVSELVSDSTTTTVYEEEACKLARFVCKVYLLLSELELQVHIDEELRGKRAGHQHSRSTLDRVRPHPPAPPDPHSAQDYPHSRQPLRRHRASRPQAAALYL